MTDPKPTLPEGALYGALGDFVRSCAPHTEADPAAVLLTAVASLGAVIGRSPHVLAGNDRHPPCFFVVIVGATSKGGKGTSAAIVRSLLERVDSQFMSSRNLGGFGSGESLVDAIADGDDETPGVADPRLLVFESEFARFLRAASREGSTLSMMTRDLWDGRKVEARSRNKSSVSTRHHVGVVGHITSEEIRARLTDVETFSGFSNRFLFGSVARANLLPEGGNVPEEVLQQHAEILRPLVRRAATFGRVRRTASAESVWDGLYRRMAEDEPGGILGAVIGRDVPQVLRLSLLYALLDGRDEIDSEHVLAAAALWQFCRESAASIFKPGGSNSVEDQLLKALRDAGTQGMTNTQQHKFFGGHQTAARLSAARDSLAERGLVTTTTVQTGGAPSSVTHAVAKQREIAKQVPRPAVVSPISLPARSPMTDPRCIWCLVPTDQLAADGETHCHVVCPDAEPVIGASVKERVPA